MQVWTAVPTMLLRIQNLPQEVFSSYDLSSLIALNTGAAPVPQSLKEWIVKQFGDHILWETYGASEAGMISYTSPEHQLSKPGTSGLPYDEVDISIVDEQWNRAKAGETGEIAVKTPVVIDHYLGREALGGDTLRDGYYRTGDVRSTSTRMASITTDRIKDMIVAGGVNIYPAGDQEGADRTPRGHRCRSNRYPPGGLRRATPWPSLSPTTPGRPSAERISVSFLQGRLASYKHPRQFEFVDELPRNSMGKVLKTELRAPYWVLKGSPCLMPLSPSHSASIFSSSVSIARTAEMPSMARRLTPWRQPSSTTRPTINSAAPLSPVLDVVFSSGQDPHRRRLG